MKSTERFTGKADNYAKYRPSYPTAILDFLRLNNYVNANSIVADIGSGTGKSSELFVKAAFVVYAVEPNKEMAQKAVELLGQYNNFHSLDGTAEETGLPTASIDLIISGQAFHYFDIDKTRTEFKRISRRAATVALFWNELSPQSAFENKYNDLILTYRDDRGKGDNRNIDLKKIDAFFEPNTYSTQSFANYQTLNLEGIQGRLLSSSHMPTANDPKYIDMSRDLKAIFDKYGNNGLVRINYQTKLYLGTLQ